MKLRRFCTSFINLTAKNRLPIIFFIIAAILLINVNPGLASDITDMDITVDGVSKRYTAQRIKLVINGAEQENLKIPLIELDGYAYVPASDVLLSLGAVATLNVTTGDMLVNFQGKLMILSADSDTVNINGRKSSISAPPKLVNGIMMIPALFFSETLDLPVTTDGINKIVYIWGSRDFGTSTQTPIPPVSEAHEPTPPPLTDAHEPTPPTNTADTTEDKTEDIPSSMSSERPSNLSTTPITAESHPLTKITGIQTSVDSNDFMILSSSKISSVESHVLPDGRIVIDIFNAEFNLDANIFPVDHPNVEQIRAAQNQTTPEYITRIVFDVKAASDFYIDLSNDRKSISVCFMKNTVLDIEFSTDAYTDTVSITTQSHAKLNVYPATDPQRIIIDTPNSDLDKVINEQAYGRFVKSIHSELIEPRTARIVLELNTNAAYELSGEGNNIQVSIFEPTYKNIFYDIDTHTIKLEKPAGLSFNLNEIGILDEYHDLRYVLNLPLSLEKTIGHGEYVVKDDYLHSIMVNNVDGRTQIVLYEKQILTTTITDDSANVYIKIQRPKDKYDRIVVLDPGHGGKDPGVPGAKGIQMHEKEINLDVAKKTQALLEREGSVKVYATRLTDVYPGLYERVEFANTIGDLFVSIHANSSEDYPSANGTEVHYLPHDNDAYIGIKSEDVADIILENLLAKLGTRNRNIKETNYLVLRNQIPSVLVEMGFLTNIEEANKLITDSFRTSAAEGLYNGILEVFKTYKPKR